jgi:hypothetical protein
MASLSIGQKIILHLDRFKSIDPNEKFNIPWDLTQDGIAASLRISRAHASIELKKLRENGKVVERQTHIKGGKVQRKSYTLSSMGDNDARNIKEYAAKNGIDIDFQLDLKRQNANILLTDLDPESRMALGRACTFRIPVPTKMLGETQKAIVPTDVAGMTVIADRLRDNVLKAATKDELIEWHRFAEEFWSGDTEFVKNEIGRIHERLYHLIECDWDREFCRVVSNNTVVLIETANDDLHDTLNRAVKLTDKYASDVLFTIIEVDRLAGDHDGMVSAIERLKEYDKPLADIYCADLAAENGDIVGAMKILASMGADNPMAQVRKARLAYAKGEYAIARELVNSVCGISESHNFNIGLERFILLAQIDLKEGKKNDAVAHLSKAASSVNSEHRVAVLSRYADLYGIDELRTLSSS